VVAIVIVNIVENHS